MQFYILMIDYGKPRPGRPSPSGLEAVVQPELTRRQIVELTADIILSGRNEIAFIKFVDGNFIEDVTAEILAEAEQREVA